MQSNSRLKKAEEQRQINFAVSGQKNQTKQQLVGPIGTSTVPSSGGFASSAKTKRGSEGVESATRYSGLVAREAQPEGRGKNQSSLSQKRNMLRNTLSTGPVSQGKFAPPSVGQKVQSTKNSKVNMNSTTLQLGLGKQSSGAQGSQHESLNFQHSGVLHSAHKVKSRKLGPKSPLRQQESQTNVLLNPLMPSSSGVKDNSDTNSQGQPGVSTKTPTALGPQSLVTHFRSNVSASSHGSNSSRNLHSHTSLVHGKGQFGYKKGSMTNRGSQNNSALQHSSQENFMSASQAVGIREGKASMKNKSYQASNNMQNVSGGRERLPVSSIQNQILGQQRAHNLGHSGRQTGDLHQRPRHAATSDGLTLPEQHFSSPQQLLHSLQNQGSAISGHGDAPMRGSNTSNTSYNVRSSAGEMRRSQVNRTTNMGGQIQPSSMMGQHGSLLQRDNNMEIETNDTPTEQEEDVPTVSIQKLVTNLVQMELSRKQEEPLSENLVKSQDIHAMFSRVFQTVHTEQQIIDCELDLKNQRVVKADAERTRLGKLRSVWKVKDAITREDKAIIDDDIKIGIERVLTYYAKEADTTYKQGLNELLAPFLWLSMQFKPSAEQSEASAKYISENPLSLSYHCLVLFVKNLVPTLYIDDDFVCLQSCFCFMRLLLKYHDPELCQVLSGAMVTPDMYATSWFMTSLATKCNLLSVTCELWNIFFETQDPKFFLFVTLALIISNREAIFSHSRSDLPLLMASLSLATIDEVKALIKTAHSLKKSTPSSFLHLDEMETILGSQAQGKYKALKAEDKVHLHLSLEQMQCLPIQIEELLHNIYPSQIKCENCRCLSAEIEALTSKPIDSNEDYIFSERIQSIIEGGRLNDVLVSVEFIKHENEEFNTEMAGTGVKVNNMVFSPTKIQKKTSLMNNQGSSFKNVQGSMYPAENVNQLRVRTLNSSSKSPFKTMVKQQPIEADASVVPMETETNVRDDDEDCASPGNPSSLYSLLRRQVRSSFASHKGVKAYCEECKRAAEASSPTRHSDPNKIRLVVIDVRSEILQNETMLPRTGKLDFNNNLDKNSLSKQIKDILAGFTAQHEQIHICLIGLKNQEVPKSYDEAHEMGFGFSPLAKTQHEGVLDLSSFHETVLGTVVEIFYKEQTKFVSFLPGGFKECHDYIQKLNLVQLQKMCIEGLSEPPFLEFLEPHDQENCFNCFMIAEHYGLQQPVRIASQSTLKVNQPINRRSEAVTYVPSDRFAEPAGELTSRKQTFTTYPLQNPSASPTLHGEMVSTSSKYSIAFTLDANSPIKEENKQSTFEQATDIFGGFRSWWQDNITNQKLLSGFTAVTDMEITNPPSNKRAGSYHRERGGTQPVLNNVTELTRNNIGKSTKQDQPFKQQDALSLVGSQKKNGHPMMLNKKQNQSSKSFAQTFQRQNYKANEAQGAGLMPTDQSEPNSLQTQAENSQGLYSVTRHNSGMNQARDRSGTDANVKNKLAGLASGQKQQAFDYGASFQDDSQFPHSRELGAHEVNQGILSPGLPQSSHYYQVHQQRQASNSQYAKGTDRAPKLMNNLHTSLMDSDYTVQGQQKEGLQVLPQQYEIGQGLQVDRNVLQLQHPPGRFNPSQKTESSTQVGPFAQVARNQPQVLRSQPEEVKASSTNVMVTESKDDDISNDQRNPQSILTTESKDQQSEPGMSSQGQMNKPGHSQAAQKKAVASQQFLLEERSYYLCNGIQKQQSYNKFLDKVQRIIEVDFVANPVDIVVYHVKRLASSHLQQSVQQQQLAQQRGDKPTFSETFGPVPIENAQITSIIITQFTTICLCQTHRTIQSRFFMHDLIKITSRKSSSKIITFYFRIPKFGEYNESYFEELEKELEAEAETPDGSGTHKILDYYNLNPRIPYQFAYKRKNFQEVKMGFEFKTEEEAKDCIERVSILYKRLKENKNLHSSQHTANRQ